VPVIAALSGNIKFAATALFTMAAYDWSIALNAREQCVQQVYGPGYF
jgi:hypothetical protein